MGLSSLAIAMATTVALMGGLYLLSNLVLYRGLVPLTTSIPIRGFSKPLFYLLIMPGTVIHELSHWAACALTRVRVFEVHVFRPQPNGVVGQVIYERCDPVRRNLIAFAPFLGGSLALFIVTTFAFPGPKAPDLARLALKPDDLWSSLGLTLGSVLTLLSQADLDRLSTWLFFYLVFSVGYGIAPSKTDLSHLLVDGLAVVGLSAGLYVADVVWRLGLGDSGLLNGIAAGLAGLLQGLNTLLLFSAVVIGLGSIVLVPVATLLQQLRRR
ncbi:MAG: hypothetical protein Q8O07_08810 [Chloroflexota bacterium]|nr:hypothetical protein [Chloroflexota bacterium]